MSKNTATPRGHDSSPAAEEHDPFSISPETRMMMRSIPYSHLRGYGSRPNVAATQARVDCRNVSYRHVNSSERSKRRAVSTLKSDYSHVSSKIDTGRRKLDRRTKYATDTTELATQLSAARRRLTQLKRSVTLPHMSFPSTPPTSGETDVHSHRSRKVSAPPVVSRSSKNQVKSRVDCSDPHPEVTRQKHSLEELQIVQDTSVEQFNPRFQPLPRPTSASRLHKQFSLPAGVGGQATVRYTIQAKLQRRATDTSISTSSGSGGIITTDSVASVGKILKSSHGGEMEVLVHDTVVPHDREEDEGDVVKMKPSGTQTHCPHGGNTSRALNHQHEDYGSNTGHETPQQSLRDSVSSSESVGITPEYSTADVNMDAFSIDSEQKLEDLEGGWEQDATRMTAVGASDKIVGFEVSTNSTETTVNLLHLFGHKNRSVEQAQTHYQETGLWAIGEEKEEESDEEMEEEIFLSDAASGGDPEHVALGGHMPVPKLFIVDENDTVIETIKTGRRKPSKGSLLELNTTSPPPIASDCPLSLHTLAIRD